MMQPKRMMREVRDVRLDAVSPATFHISYFNGTGECLNQTRHTVFHNCSLCVQDGRIPGCCSIISMVLGLVFRSSFPERLVCLNPRPATPKRPYVTVVSSGGVDKYAYEAETDIDSGDASHMRASAVNAPPCSASPLRNRRS